MAPQAEARVELARLLAELRDELTVLDARVSELGQAASRSDAWAPGSPWLAVIALALHHIYSSLESMMERIVRALEGTMPSGSDWHRELLKLATLELPDYRPAIFSASNGEVLGELLRFRHFLRHGYAAPLDAERLRALAAKTQSRAASLRADVDQFVRWLATAAAQSD